MKIYLAGEREGAKIDRITGELILPLWVRNIKRRLFSYYYHSENNKISADIKASAKMGLDLFLDSGAFTAFTKKVTIPIEHYAHYVNSYKNVWTTCSSLDAIGQGEKAAKESYENFNKLKELGANVKPVFHVREPNEWLIRYIKEKNDYVFIGGMVPETTQWLMQRLDELWTTILTHADGTPKVKIHGFGLTDQKLMFRYPWYSVDSTSWLMLGIYGSCFIPIGNKVLKINFSNESTSLRKINGWHFKNLPLVSQKEVRELMVRYGVTPEQCAEHYSFRDAVNAQVFQEMERMAITKFTHSQETLF